MNVNTVRENLSVVRQLIEIWIKLGAQEMSTET